jgi:hypothetical protein
VILLERSPHALRVLELGHPVRRAVNQQHGHFDVLGVVDRRLRPQLGDVIAQRAFQEGLARLRIGQLA